ncbi:MAG: transglycosylase SLT domain-containing protein [Bdellovibrionales bacterium]|nr:transglycosylase SLT domain-containing protein [Bdellovibrionales bacterium]
MKRKNTKPKPFTRERLRDNLKRLSLIYLGLGFLLLCIGGVAIYVGELQESGDFPSFRKKDASWNYFYPRWGSQSFWDHIMETPDESDQKLSKTFADIHQIISDPEDRVDNLFSVPSVLSSRVLFWMDVYARYDSRIRIVHDRDDVGIVYGYIDLRPLYQKYRRSPIIAHKKSRRIEKEILDHLGSLLENAQYESAQSPHLPDESAPLRSYLKSLGLFSRIYELKESLRTQTGQKDKFQMGILRSQKLMTHIESVFKDYKLPLPLARIPFVESSFNPAAYSKVGATGLWQIMPSTAKELIHRTDKKRWRDPILQTKAAARLLRNYRKVLPDWGTTVTAYNSGVGTLGKLLKEYKAKSYEQLYSKMGTEGLGFAGRNFYSELLAATLVEAYKEKIFSLEISPDDVAKVYKHLAPFDEELCQVR